MSTLGPGTRVYIGWCAPDRGHQRACCCTGTIVDGPFGAYESVPGFDYPCTGRAWIVRLDDRDQRALAAEFLLHPLDGGEPERIEDEREVTA